MHPGALGMHPGAIGMHPRAVGMHENLMGMHARSLGMHENQTGMHDVDPTMHDHRAGMHDAAPCAHTPPPPRRHDILRPIGGVIPGAAPTIRSIWLKTRPRSPAAPSIIRPQRPHSFIIPPPLPPQPR
ncbi:MAG TPA: hypothetical protein VGR35_21355 [Tepidisphaeraceae bacterium]|nr:hypothetical protein [Tepidisphaeraceae bacterium]